MPRESLVKPTKVFTLSSALIVKKLCRLSDRPLQLVLQGLRDLYSYAP